MLPGQSEKNAEKSPSENDKAQWAERKRRGRRGRVPNTATMHSPRWHAPPSASVAVEPLSPPFLANRDARFSLGCIFIRSILAGPYSSPSVLKMGTLALQDDLWT